VPTQAETWVGLRVSPYSMMINVSDEEWPRYWTWLTQTKMAVAPCDRWEEMYHVYQGRPIRLGRMDFPDGSSAVSNETWYELNHDHHGVAVYAYYLLWTAVRIQ
jgi:hypothetical protein